MKFWNKDKNVRQRCWTKVSIRRKNGPLLAVPGGWINDPLYYSQSDMKRWCQLQESAGKFYVYHASDNWWFENEQDAVVFKLKWA